MSASFEFYKSVYMGEIDSEVDFLRYRKRAVDYLSYLTAGKADPYLACEPAEDLDEDILKKVNLAVCAVADQSVAVDASKKSVMSGYAVNGGFLASETVGSHSRTFRSGFEVSKEAESALQSAATSYLAWTGLLYRGIPCTRHT